MLAMLVAEQAEGRELPLRRPVARTDRARCTTPASCCSAPRRASRKRARSSRPASMPSSRRATRPAAIAACSTRTPTTTASARSRSRGCSCARSIGPSIAAGGLMDGAGIAAALRLGASAAQLGTAFVACDESQADAGYRAALQSDAAHHTVMTRAISGRPARSLAESLHRARPTGRSAPTCPTTRSRTTPAKALHAAGKAKGEFGFGAQWAGQGAPLSRPMPAAELVALLRREITGG